MVDSATSSAQNSSGGGRRGVFKTYGSEGLRKRSHKQDTLTQMDFVKLYTEQDDDDLTEKPRKRRRKMTGGISPEKMTYTTQTITQLDWSFTSNPEEDLPSDDRAISSLLKPRPLSTSRNVPTKTPQDGSLIISNTKPSVPDSSVSTPQGTVRTEIPSSQSPATPVSLHSLNFMKWRSPLSTKSNNIAVQFKPWAKTALSPTTSTKIGTEDVLETEETSIIEHITPKKLFSSPKTVRFAVEDVVMRENRTSGFIPLTHPRRLVSSQVEIADSDADSEDEIEVRDTESEGSLEEHSFKEENVVEASDEGGDETHGANLFNPIEGESRSMEKNTYDSLREEPLTGEGLADLPNVCPERQIVRYKSLQESELVPNILSQREGETQYSLSPIALGESQRLDTQHVNAMAQRTRHSDIFISIYPQAVANIVNRTKDHEFRVYEIPHSVSRLWIYETRPACMLKYMATISRAKRPGEIMDEQCKGNREFNAKPAGKNFAYEILELYELADSLTLENLIKREWINAAPQKYSWVRPAVLDELMANLKPQIFGKAPAKTSSDSYSGSPSSPPYMYSDSRRIEVQTMGSMPHCNQVDGSLPSARPANLPSSSRHDSPTPHPSQASTVDLTQPPSSPTPDVEIIRESPCRSALDRRTTSRLPSTRRKSRQRTPTRNEVSTKIRVKRQEGQSGKNVAVAKQRTTKAAALPQLMLIPSSQFLTESQMLPDSLMNEIFTSPP